MPKPIFIVGMPKTTPISEFMYIQKMLSESLPDYYSLVYFTNANEVDFKCFYEKDFDDIKFEDLKQFVLSNIPAPPHLDS